MSKICLRKEINRAAAIASRVKVVQSLLEMGYYAGVIPMGRYKQLNNKTRSMVAQVHNLIDVIYDAEVIVNHAVEVNHD